MRNYKFSKPSLQNQIEYKHVCIYKKNAYSLDRNIDPKILINVTTLKPMFLQKIKS